MHTIKINTIKFCFGIPAVLVVFFITPVHGQWRYSAYLQTSAGNYIYTSTARNYYLTQGLQYRHGRLRTEVSLALAARDGDNLIAEGESEHMAMDFGLGDVFVRGYYTLALPRNGWPGITLGALAKIPTASAARGLGTGEWDAGIFLSLARFVSSFYVSAEVGWLWLGDPPDATYRDAVSYAIGLGRNFVNNRLGLLMLYSGTGKIFAEYEAPQQVGVGASWRASNRLWFFTNLAGGLSETVPDISFSVGVSSGL